VGYRGAAGVGHDPGPDGGYVVGPDRPGIGVAVREDKLTKFPHRAHSIVGHFQEDGSVAH